MSGKAATLAYRPIGMAGGLLAGMVSSTIVRQVWKRVSNEEDPPGALQTEYPLWEILLSAALQGAVFAATKAAMDRFGAEGFAKLTGAWPGD